MNCSVVFGAMLGLPGVTTMDVRVGGAAGVPDIPPPPPPPHPASAAVSKIIIAAVPNTFFMLCLPFSSLRLSFSCRRALEIRCLLRKSIMPLVGKIKNKKRRMFRSNKLGHA